MLRRILLPLAFAALLYGQEYRGTITGRITDPSGSPVPNVKIITTKVDTHTIFASVSGTEGFYTVPLLPPGTYEVSAESAGFKKYVQSGIELAAGGRSTVDIALSRSFRLREWLSLQTRAEAFNSLNHVNFGGPNATISSSTFGQITGAGSQRVLQGSMKLVF